MKMETGMTTQELGITDLITEGFRRYFRNFKNILFIYLCTVLPASFLSSAVGAAFSLLGDLSSSALKESESLGLLLCSGVGLLSLLTGILAGAAGFWATLAVARLIEDDILDRNPGWKEALRASARRLLSAIGTSIAMAVLLVLLMLCLIVPGLIFSIYWLFTPYAVVLRGLGGQQALDYSKSLVTDRWWMVLITYFVFGIVTVAVCLPVMLGLAVLSLVPFTGFLTTTALQIAAALFTVLMVVYFLNLDYLCSGGPGGTASVPAAASAPIARPFGDAPELPQFRLPDRRDEG
jgi:hypothetical protein